MSYLLRVVHDPGSAALGGSYYYVAHAGAAGPAWRPTGYLFGGPSRPEAAVSGGNARAAFEEPIRCRMDHHHLSVPPFRLHRFGQTFVSPVPLTLDLSTLAPGPYMVLAVHNFHVEDRSPDLDECVAGVFLAGRRDDGEWEEPERYPIECRAIGTIGRVEVSPADGAEGTS